MVYVGMVGDGNVGVAQFTDAWPAGAATIYGLKLLWGDFFFGLVWFGRVEEREKRQNGIENLRSEIDSYVKYYNSIGN